MRLAFTQYIKRLSDAELEGKQLDKRDDQVANLRLILAALGAGVAWFWYSGSLAVGWLFVPVVLFVGFIVLHRRLLSERRVADRKRAYYKNGVDRLSDEWSGCGASGKRYLDLDHEYAADLDLFGVGSLFQLVNGARTQLGEDRLAEWLCSAADRDTIIERQGAVARLRDELELREELALLAVNGGFGEPARPDEADDADIDSGELRDEFDSSLLVSWSGRGAQRSGQVPRAIAVVISICTLIAGAGALAFDWSWYPALVGFALALALQLYFKSEILATMQDMNEAGKGLHTLSQVLEIMQRQKFDDPYLDRIVQRLRVDGLPPSQQVARLAKLIAYLNDSTRNQLFIPVGIVLGLPLHLTHALDTWRMTVGREIPTWLEAVGDFEATLSLSRFAFERPTYPFPTIAIGPLVLEAKGLGHPLLSRSDCVANDLSLGGEQRLLMVSGSNMSGKSTLLRTIGINTVLAQMGAPVCAQKMALTPFQVATAMRVSDSLQDGQSLFFAVLSRLKRVVDLTQSETVLFLLDEILQGTNSHDRRIGAEAVIRSLLDKEALGLVTTHDLSLTQIASTLPNVANVHFMDKIEDGEMTFDYQLRDGTLKKSNAIELMRLVGLDV